MEVEGHGGAAITRTKAASSLKNIRFLTSGPRSGSRPPDRLEVARVFRIRLDLFANAAHVDIHRTRGDVGGVAPDRIEQLVAGKHAADVAGEIIEQAELGGGCGHQACRAR